MSTNTDRKAPIGLSKLVIWKNLTDTLEELTYGPAISLEKTIMTATHTPAQSTAVLDADNQPVESITLNNGGTLAINLTAVNGTDRTVIYGNKIENGTVKVNKDDMGSYVAVAYQTNRSDGRINLYKFLKIMFAEQAETFNTLKKEGVEFATSNIQGEYVATINNGMYRYIRMAADPVNDAALIDKWFTDAKYSGEGSTEEDNG